MLLLLFVPVYFNVLSSWQSCMYFLYECRCQISTVIPYEPNHKLANIKWEGTGDKTSWVSIFQPQSQRVWFKILPCYSIEGSKPIMYQCISSAGQVNTSRGRWESYGQSFHMLSLPLWSIPLTSCICLTAVLFILLLYFRSVNCHQSTTPLHIYSTICHILHLNLIM